MESDALDAGIRKLLVRHARGKLPAEAMLHLGQIFATRGAFDLARQYFEAACRAAPGDPRMRRMLGMSLLRQGRLREGLEHYEARWQMAEFAPARPFPLPQWNGEPLRGKSILLWGEQGVGDQLMQARCLEPLLASGAGIALACDPRLIPLLARRHPKIEFLGQRVQLFPGPRAPRFDFHSSLLSAWRWTVAGDRMPAAKPYLRADSALVERFRRAWRQRNWRFNVGISWRSKAKKIGAAKSIDLSLLRPLLADPRITVHSLQYGVETAEIPALSKNLGRPVWIDREGDPLNNLDRLAAQIKALDLVISTSNATVHLAGAQGVPTWALLPVASDWRWGEDGEQTWVYQNMRLFRQRHPGSWSDVAARLRLALDGRLPQA